MTEYNENYDYSDEGTWDETDSSCVNCCDPEAYYYSGEYLCSDCLITRFRAEIDLIALDFMVQGGVAPDLIKENMRDLQVELLTSPKNRDFIGVYLIFDYEREISVAELESNKINLKETEEEEEELSACCGAPFYSDSDICTECKEHG